MHILKFLLAVLLIAMITACKKASVTPNNPASPTVKMDTDVYVLGSITAKNGKAVTAYWKNGILTKLTDSTTNVIPFKLLINGSDIYITAVSSNPGKGKAVFFKNGVMTELTSGSYDAYPSDIAVKGNDVYIAGGVFPDQHDIAVYWKNGVEHDLKNNSPDTYGFGLDLSGNDVYVAGSARAANTIYYASLWKNDVNVSITDTTSNSEALAVKVNGNDVYVVGSKNYEATYWKNGVAAALQGGTRALDVAISGNDVYILGQGTGHAVYWKNGTLNSLTDGTNITQADRFTVTGNDVYAAGLSFTSNNLESLPVYWKNGHVVYLKGSSTGYSDNLIESIAVVVRPVN